MTAPPPPLSAFPSLARDEFTTACRALIARVDAYQTPDEGGGNLAGLGWTGVRLETKIEPVSGQYLLVQDDEVVLIIHRLLDEENSTPPQQLKHVDVLESHGAHKNDTTEIFELDENDPEELIRQPYCNSKLQVEYNIMLSPTYQVPILYFFVHNNANTSAKTSPKGLLDIIYNRLVPAQYRSELRDVGIMGGISFGHHPLSDLPVYFVHPCNTADAMRDVAENLEVTAETYLLLWLGLVGNCVGLHIPSGLLIDKQNP
ncbi:uncharacterized protein PADG_03961 [Paracoccidioides brasiliensis Pb18]|uniref:Ubiquitin-like-conjugating enzyme ATG10 n=1 Tax=Paracoccidioides brasiliensis (strain Pb18) TaxID=502780 RepID=C1G9M5_PARBD|nr:uncharacterized protein PADG_03961 [Paracoccidioides brasiliensis Pb18]EEH47877.2 hypothetical protein PADG_03961 [Paracoccidioides brasiliensis Pb18]